MILKSFKWNLLISVSIIVVYSVYTYTHRLGTGLLVVWGVDFDKIRYFIPAYALSVAFLLNAISTTSMYNKLATTIKIILLGVSLIVVFLFAYYYIIIN